MTDDPYPSMKPVTDWITGFFLSVLTVTLPLTAILQEGRVKIDRNGIPSSRASGAQVEEINPIEISARTTPPDTFLP